MNIMPFNILHHVPIPTLEDSNKPNRVNHGLSNNQMGFELQMKVLNLGPPTRSSFNTMLNYQLTYKFKLVGFEFNINIMAFNTCERYG